MANIITKRTQDDPKLEGKEPDGPIESFYLGRSIRGVQLTKPQSIPISINGFTRYANMGDDNEMEKEFVDVIEQSASTMVEVPDEDERNPRGTDRPAKMKVENLGDYEIRRNHKTVADVRSKETITVPGGIHHRKIQRGPKRYNPAMFDEPSPSVSGEALKED